MRKYDVGDVVNVRMEITRNHGNGFFTMKDFTTGLHTIPEQNIESCVVKAAPMIPTVGQPRRIDVNDVMFRTGDEVRLHNVTVVSNQPGATIYAKCPSGKLHLIPKSLVAEVLKRAETPEEMAARLQAVVDEQVKIIDKKSKDISELVNRKHRQADVIRHWETVANEMLSGKLKLVWTAWNGGECPINPEELCFVKLRNGLFNLDKGGNFNWLMKKIGHDIVMYAPFSVSQ
jgi:hypothetical protein